MVPSIFTTNCLDYASTQECGSNPLFEYNGSWQFQITLTEEAGLAAMLTSFTIDGASYTAQIASLFGSASIPARGSVTATITLTSVAAPKNVVFVFGGTDANNNSWSTQMSVAFEGTQPALTVAGVNNAASGQNAYAPGMLMAIYGAGLGTFVQAAAAIPLPQYLAGFEAFINGYPCPLYYVSANQVNVQIPYEITPGPATLTVGNPWENVTYGFTVSANAPGIFVFSDGSVNPSRTAARGQETFLYITGEGQVAPSLADGATPAGNTPLSALPQTEGDGDGDGGQSHGWPVQPCHARQFHAEFPRHYLRPGGSDADQFHHPEQRAHGSAAGGGHGGKSVQPACHHHGAVKQVRQVGNLRRVGTRP